MAPARHSSRAEVVWPDTVGGYAVRPVLASLPGLGDIGALVVDENADADSIEDVPEWVPAEWLSPVMGDDTVSDVYGAIGVWPAAFVAAQELMRFAESSDEAWSCLELGCGAGFPSLVAARLGATVYALDTEQLTLDLLQEAFNRQCAGKLTTVLGDACDLQDEPLESVSVVIISDLLYSVQLGRSLGTRLGRWLREAPGRRLLLTDGGRSGRAAFLEAFDEAYGKAFFEDVPVPPWAAQRADFFDGNHTTSVGLLRY